jgi:polyisoprenoid-binding protein YceI
MIPRILILPSLLLFRLAAQTSLYEIKPGPDSRFALEIHKTGLMSGKKHLFLFERYAGAIHYNPAAPESSRIEVNVEAGSFVVKDDWVSASQAKSIREEAEGRNGLEVAKHSTIRFVSSSVARAGEGFTVQGTLAIRGIEKPVTVNVAMKPGEAGTLRFEGKAEVRLKDYGIKPPTAALGAIGTRNEMAVTFTLIAAPRR